MYPVAPAQDERKSAARYRALTEDLQRENELAPVLLLAAADIGLRRHHAQRVVRQPVAAIVRLAAPDREHDAGRNAKTLFDFVQRGAMFLHQLLPLRREPRDGSFLDVIGRHLHELGLRRRAGSGPPRQDQIRQFVVGLEPLRLGIERRARHAGSLRLRPQRGDELGKGGVGGVNRAHRARRHRCQYQKRGYQPLSQTGILSIDTLPINARRPVWHVRRNHSTACRHRQCRSPTE